MDSIKNNTVTTNEGKNTAIIAYITIIGLIIAFVMNSDKKSDFASYHIKQSLGLALTGLALGIIGMIPILGWIINLIGIFVLLFIWIMGLVNAINGQEKPVPILGTMYLEWFKNL
ncbi:hypothetical protein ESY86_08740 [Subsaximicrobium wynnwilliamsii]|uniref:DUF4870 domain-containing protein n=1 Tax=Subsaximicrobium wynnwilliamsii TaxID=291179 RepID=A0A5C6ZLD7_9FLAO|nr:hypothetical protein [Subsaximicrobium wynnwilliamsii]TXD83658.1 hypothetical protein ESY87_08465 [Subsaximicrobium wynnwilliamsii]TXD89457.1 hypothetical protein ESY86_08740 [Subsaximicrobium wynnwilliamsii]TXE03495.1 hypothetical protein ESY88_07490 [Subsaximicrobium wynnwilliamsii]